MLTAADSDGPGEGDSDREFVPAGGVGKRSRVGEREEAVDSVDGDDRTKRSTPRGNHSDDGDDIDGCPICYEPWSVGGIHRVCSLRCGHLFGKQ